MKRQEWEFRYTATQLAEAAAKKRDHHRERTAWWITQKEAVMAEIKESGIEVSESVAAQYSNTTMKMAPQVMVRSDLQSKLNECYGKITKHQQIADEYDGWFQVMQGRGHNGVIQLAASTEPYFDLHQDDWLYFFGE